MLTRCILSLLLFGLTAVGAPAAESESAPETEYEIEVIVFARAEEGEDEDEQWRFSAKHTQERQIRMAVLDTKATPFETSPEIKNLEPALRQLLDAGYRIINTARWQQPKSFYKNAPLIALHQRIGDDASAYGDAGNATFYTEDEEEYDVPYTEDEDTYPVLYVGEAEESAAPAVVEENIFAAPYTEDEGQYEATYTEDEEEYDAPYTEDESAYDTYESLYAKEKFEYDTLYAKDAYEFVGFVRIYTTALIYADVDLQLAPTASYAANPRKDADDAEPQVYFITEKRRLKFQQAHYFDHPRFGAILGVWQAP